jgi:N-acetylmuramoyl-L-alanine amidase
LGIIDIKKETMRLFKLFCRCMAVIAVITGLSVLAAEDDMKVITQLLPYNDNLQQRQTGSIDLIVLHCTETPTLEEARAIGEKILYSGSRTGNSGHYYIDRDGQIYCYVTDDRVAHHTKGYNQTSIGIEIVNSGRYPHWRHSAHQAPTEKYTPAQIRATIELLKYLKKKYPKISGLERHSDLDRTKIPAKDKPGILINRKIDPGPLFPWQEVLKRWTEK